MTDEERNGLLLDVILAALKGYVETPKSKRGNDNDSDRTRNDGQVNFSYLLGQSIRQWQIPKENWHLSKSAKYVWEYMQAERVGKNTTMPMAYKEQFICHQERPIPRFAGTKKQFGLLIIENTKAFTTSKKGKISPKKYVFNDIFIAEHTIPVSDIKDALEQCYLSHKSAIETKGIKTIRKDVELLLNKIHITQMLKIEDRRINRCSARIKQMCEGLGKEPYNYLIDTKSEQIYDDLCKYCYANLEYDTNKSEPSQEALGMAEKFEWAKAIDVYDSQFEIITLNEYL